MLNLNGHIFIWEEAENSSGQLLSKYILQGAVLLPSLHAQVHFHLSPSFHKQTWTRDLIRISLPLCTLSLDAKQLQGFGPPSSFSPHNSHFIFPFSPQEASCLGDRGGLLSLLAITETTDGDKEVGFSNLC